MKTYRQYILFFLLLVSAVLVTLAYAQDGTDSQPDSGTSEPQARTPELGSDSNPDRVPEVSIPNHLQPASATAETNDLEAVVYFTPQDENTSTTILFLYNTSTLTATVGLETYRLDGSTYISTSLLVPPNHLIRISGDSINPIATWTDTVLVNFTSNSTYARMTLPEGVKAEGYVAWNGANPFDPLEAVPTLPLRFSTDPATIFLPNIQRD